MNSYYMSSYYVVMVHIFKDMVIPVQWCLFDA